MNIPEVKLGIVAVSRDCFPIALSQQRRKNIVAAYGEGIYECPITVENEKDALAALADVCANGVNALVVFLGNFGPETPETLLCQKFHGPTMYVAAAEVVADMQKEMNGKIYPDLLERMAQFELTLLDWAEEHKGARKYVAFADKCWPAFPEQFGFEPCYVNSRLARLLSTVCSVTAMAICAPTLLRARFCLLLPVPLAALASSAFPKWDVSTVTY